MSITLSAAKARYLEQVRDQLSDLPEEEREEIVQDLEAHLAELDDGRIEAELGDPVAFAAEFRSSAGLDEPTRKTTWDAVLRVWNRIVTDVIGRTRPLARDTPGLDMGTGLAGDLRLGLVQHRGAFPALSDSPHR